MQQGLPGDSAPSPAAAPAVAALRAKLAGGADLGRSPARGVGFNATWTWRWTSGPCPTSQHVKASAACCAWDPEGMQCCMMPASSLLGKVSAA